MVHAHKRRRRTGFACAAVAALAAAAIPAAGRASSVHGSDAAASGSARPYANTSAPNGGASRQRTGVVPGEVLVTLAADTSVTGTPVPGTRTEARRALTSNARLNSVKRGPPNSSDIARKDTSGNAVRSSSV